MGGLSQWGIVFFFVVFFFFSVQEEKQKGNEHVKQGNVFECEIELLLLLSLFLLSIVFLYKRSQ